MRDFVRLWITLLMVTVLVCGNCRAAGAYKVAGQGFDAAVRGKPIVWRNDVLRYWTDLGDLNANIKGSDADQAVAWALQQWTQVPTAALNVLRAGQFAEDVSGANVTLWNGTLELPADAQAGANGESLTVVYDNGGAITDLLYGVGASDPAECATNAVISYVDAYAADGHFSHAVMIVNGNCFASTVDLQYVLVRKMGRLLGMGWSQVNDNVVTGAPPATSPDLAGYPRMHPLEAWCTDNCFYDSALRADDVAAVSRLYPVTAENIGQWPPLTKALFRETTVRISGRVLFANGAGMQGVNVVARLIDPDSGQPSRVVAVSCVSGFRFRGNAGNPITGYTDTTGARFDRFGGDDVALAGYYEIAGLPLPLGPGHASYQISVEPVNPIYSGDMVVGPYEWAGVTPSGSFAPVVVGPVAAGADLLLDIPMQGSSAGPPFAAKGSQQMTPLSIPQSGMWVSNLADYGHASYLKFLARANRSFSVEVTAVDERNHATQSKLAPVLGAWNASDVVGTPAVVTSAPFDSSASGVTWLNAVTSADDVVTVGIADMRGDGRPDYAYVARLFYADTVLPARVQSGEGTITITGKGFTSAATVMIGGVQATVKSVNVTRMAVAVPVLADGVYDIELRDTVTGAVAAMYRALQIGDAVATITLLSQAAGGSVALGSVTPQNMRIRVVASDGTPLADEAVVFSASPNTVVLTACGGSSCTIFTNQAGEAESGAVINFAGTNTVTASLPNGGAVSTTYSGMQMSYSVSALLAEQWIAASANRPAEAMLTAQLLKDSIPLANTVLTFSSTGPGAPAPVTSTTDTHGMAAAQLTMAQQQGGVDLNVSACATVPGNPCAPFLLHEIDSSRLQIRVLQGDGQSVTPGTSLVPIVFQAVDTAGHPVLGAAVSCQILAYAASSGRSTDGSSETQTGQTAARKLVRQESQQAVTLSDGTVVVVFGNAYASANLDIEIKAVLANGAAVQAMVRVRTM